MTLDKYRQKVNYVEVIKTIIYNPNQFVAYRDSRCKEGSLNKDYFDTVTEMFLEFWTNALDNDFSPQAYIQFLMVRGITNTVTLRGKMIEYKLVLDDYMKWLNEEIKKNETPQTNGVNN
jgi:hypothetical protein